MTLMHLRQNEVRMKSFCDVKIFSDFVMHFYNGIMHWIANFNHILLFASVYTGWNREIYAQNIHKIPTKVCFQKL